MAAGGHLPDTEQQSVATTMGFAIAPVVAAIVFLMWLWSARDNVPS